MADKPVEIPITITLSTLGDVTCFRPSAALQS